MESKKILINNPWNENLNAVIEGSEGDLTVVMAHGFGTSMDELGLFVEISQKISPIARVLRFDFSSCGQSEGRQEDLDVKKLAGDLGAVLDWVRKEYGGRMIIIAHSLGTVVTRLLSPEGIEKIIFTGVTLPSSEDHVANTQRRLLTNRPGGVLNEEGMSLYPRRNGIFQKIGSSYWSELRKVDPLDLMKVLAQKSQVIILKPKQDEIVGGPEATEVYKTIPNITYLELDGDHNFNDVEDRSKLLEVIFDFIKK